MAVVELSKVTKKFGDKVVIEDLSMQIEEGKVYAITGKSGCGKSTLLNIIGGIEKATYGDVTILGRNISTRGGRLRRLLRYKVSYLFQNYALSDNDTVKYNLEMALLYSGIKDKQQAISDALQTVGLEGFERQKVYTLSGGEQQRVAIARLLLKPTELILADEPTGNLDAKNRDHVFNLLLELNKEGKTIVIVTHDMELASMCDQVIELSD